MTLDERDQLIEDIKASSNKRRAIAEQAERSKDFDIAAAWEEVEALERSIEARLASEELPDGTVTETAP
jgi:hypothetical protein